MWWSLHWQNVNFRAISSACRAAFIISFLIHLSLPILLSTLFYAIPNDTKAPWHKSSVHSISSIFFPPSTRKTRITAIGKKGFQPMMRQLGLSIVSLVLWFKKALKDSFPPVDSGRPSLFFCNLSASSLFFFFIWQLAVVLHMKSALGPAWSDKASRWLMASIHLPFDLLLFRGSASFSSNLQVPSSIILLFAVLTSHEEFALGVHDLKSVRSFARILCKGQNVTFNLLVCKIKMEMENAPHDLDATAKSILWMTTSWLVFSEKI